MKREHKTLAGIAAVMFGSAHAAQPFFIELGAMYIGGLLALAGGIYIVDQVMAADEEATAA